MGSAISLPDGFGGVDFRENVLLGCVGCVADVDTDDGPVQSVRLEDVMHEVLKLHAPDAEATTTGSAADNDGPVRTVQDVLGAPCTPESDRREMRERLKRSIERVNARIQVESKTMSEELRQVERDHLEQWDSRAAPAFMCGCGIADDADEDLRAMWLRRYAASINGSRARGSGR